MLSAARDVNVLSEVVVEPSAVLLQPLNLNSENVLTRSRPKRERNILVLIHH